MLHRRGNQISPILSATEKSLSRKNNPTPDLEHAWKELWDDRLKQCNQLVLKAHATDLKSLHHLRIAYKKLRYLIELLLNSDIVLPTDEKELKSWQDELGLVEDYRVMAKLAKRMGLPDALHEAIFTKSASSSRSFPGKIKCFCHFLATS